MTLRNLFPPSIGNPEEINLAVNPRQLSLQSPRFRKFTTKYPDMLEESGSNNIFSEGYLKYRALKSITNQIFKRLIIEI